MNQKKITVVIDKLKASKIVLEDGRELIIKEVKNEV